MGSHTSSRRTPDPVRSILDSLRRLVHGIRVYDRAAERATGLSGAQLFVLSRLALGGPASVNELAQRTSTHQSSVSVVAHKLAKSGMTTWSRSMRDGRRSEFALTGDGRKALARAPRTAQDRLIAAVGRLAPRQRVSLARLLERWTAFAGLDNAAPEMFLEEHPRRQSRQRGTEAKNSRARRRKKISRPTRA